MTAKVLVGDCREVLLTLEANSIDACVTDLFGCLKEGVGSAVTGIAQSSQIAQVVRPSIVREQAEGANVMHGLAWTTTVLTRPLIPAYSGSALRLPIRTTVRGRSAEVPRMERSNSVLVTTGARTKLAFAAAVLSMAWRSLILDPATQTGQRNVLAQTATHRDMLACRRAGPSSAMLEPRLSYLKRLSASLANGVNLHPLSIKQGVGL